MENKRFDPGSIEEQYFLLASHAPKGKLWSNVFNANSNIGKLFYSLAIEYYRFSVLAQRLYNEMDIRQADELLDEWERSVGVPNAYFDVVGDIERRRQQVEMMFTNFGGVQTADDFIRVADFFGVTVTITPGSAAFLPAPIPVVISSSALAAAHTMYVDIISGTTSAVAFPLTFPLEFAADSYEFLTAIFRVLAPANVKVIFRK